ncbi:hypothetical protein LWI29_034965 [Acer saccharum]|uniref:Gnk2-homologous domain-containing protein n=1 Tax=Acer saccharum TaxID=4024 RepID=A0AA39RTJ0_ACESA|nr:hypothetical protein LWI29_034965 [Acer saccharum]
MLLRPIPGAFLLILCAIFGFMSSITCQPTYIHHDCSGIATNNYISNLDSLLNSLSSKASVNSFYNDTSSGIYSLFLCRGDVSTATCQTCIKNASLTIRQRCPSNKTSIIWYDECMLRYSDADFFGVKQTLPGLLMWNVGNTSTPEDKNYEAFIMIYSLIMSAPDTDLMYDTKDEALADGSQHGYAMAQCTRDINNSSCSSCLKEVTSELEKCCQAKIGWRYLSPSCYIRYEEYLFYQQPPAPPPPHEPVAPQPTPIDDGKGGNNTTKIAIITLSSFVAVATAALLGFWYYSSSCRKKEQKGEGITEEILLPNFRASEHPEFDAGIHATDEEHTGEMLCFSLATIQAATNNFSNANKLGEGGFGPVYKGKLPNGKEIAVKRLSLRSSQDFGTARIFGGNQLEANTERVVGTYGYMAPEYGLEGVFSIKSDVYSFGILMLEIISGKKIRGIHHSKYGQNLLPYAWRIWNEGKGLELIDPNIVDNCPISEVLRWIHIALLCVQDDPADRPTMSLVVLMLGSQAINLPQPSTPPYSVGRFTTTLSDLSSTSTTGTGTGLLRSDTQTSSTISSK